MQPQHISFQYNPEKAREAIVYLVAHSKRGIEKGILCKLLFLADKFHLVRYGRTITGDAYFALPHGPAPTKILDLLKNDLANSPELSAALTVDHTFQYPRFSAEPLPEWNNLSKSDIEALDETVKRFGGMAFTQLRGITHETVAYQNAWDTKPSGVAAAPMAFEDFFEEDSDAIAGVLEEAIEDSRLRKAFSPGH